MNRDMRGLTFSGTGTGSIGAATVDIRTEYIDTAQLVGPLTVLARVGANAALSGTLALEHATSAAGAGSATVSADSDFPGGRANQNANSTGGNDIAAGGGEAALSYQGSRRYVRGHLRINRTGNATVAAECTVVAIGMPQVEPER